MTVDEVSKLIDALAKLVGVLAWPVLLAFVLVRFGPMLKDFFSSLGELSLKGGGIEATAKRKTAEATAALVAATVARSDAHATPETAAREAKEAAAVVAESVNPRLIRRTAEASAL